MEIQIREANGPMSDVQVGEVFFHSTLGLCLKIHPMFSDTLNAFANLVVLKNNDEPSYHIAYLAEDTLVFFRSAKLIVE